MKVIGIILIAFWLALSVLILYAVLVAASNQDDADEEAERKRHAERFWEKGDE